METSNEPKKMFGKPFFETWPVKEAIGSDGKPCMEQCPEEDACCFGLYIRDLNEEPSTATCVGDFYDVRLARVTTELLNAAVSQGLFSGESEDGTGPDSTQAPA